MLYDKDSVQGLSAEDFAGQLKVFLAEDTRRTTADLFAAVRDVLEEVDSDLAQRAVRVTFGTRRSDDEYRLDDLGVVKRADGWSREIEFATDPGDAIDQALSDLGASVALGPNTELVLDLTTNTLTWNM